MNFPVLSIVEVPGKAAGKFLKEKIMNIHLLLNKERWI
jgi:hypothetical protein